MTLENNTETHILINHNSLSDTATPLFTCYLWLLCITATIKLLQNHMVYHAWKYLLSGLLTREEVLEGVFDPCTSSFKSRSFLFIYGTSQSLKVSFLPRSLTY